MDKSCINREVPETSVLDACLTIEEPFWFGPAERPLAGWLTRPVGEIARGGILCAPPIGREARAGRRAMRSLASSLASRGFITLRFDYDGTGDSSGGFNDSGRDRAWVDSIVEATRFLRSLGVESVSAVGMRLGATLIGVAADSHNLNFSSIVLWDPCESGRSYLRELNALEAIRRDQFFVASDDSIETSEYVFSARSANEIRRLNLSKTVSVPFAERTLLMTRSDRSITARLGSHLSGDAIIWQTTNQQALLLDVDPSWATLPNQTMERIVRWLCEPNPAFAPFVIPPLSKSAIVATGDDGLAVSERFTEFGSERLFGIITEPVGDVRGPLVLMLNVAHEEHTGPSRLWVELSRRWAGFGLRSVRFDLRGLGDSPWLSDRLDSTFFEAGWLDDIIVVTRELNPEDPSNSVFIGLCSGAYWAIEAALELGAKGVCALNPPVFTDYLHSVLALERSRIPFIRTLGVRLKNLAKRRWIVTAAWHVLRHFVPAERAVDLMEELENDEVDLLLLYSVEEVWPYRAGPFFGSIDVRRLRESKVREIELIPGLDHGMHIAEGRNYAVNVLDRHVLEHFGGVTRGADSGPVSFEK